MKKILLPLFFSVVIGFVYSQTPIPKTINLLYVNPILENGMVIVYNSMFETTNNHTVGKNGTTNVILEQGAGYVISLNGKMYYPNGDECSVLYAFAIYLGENAWINTADLIALKKAGLHFNQYFVLWPKTQ